MKKNILSILLLLGAGTALVLSGCSKDDTTAPVVAITGSSSIHNPLNSAYTEQNATANDDEDGAITVVIFGDVNVDKTGDYDVTYKATDKAGNVGIATRVVHVYNEAEGFEGTYTNSFDSCQRTPSSAFNAVVALSDSINRLVIINNFGAFGTRINVYAKITANAALSPITMTVPQSLGGTASVIQIYAANTGVLSGSTPTSFKFNYKWDDGINNDSCNTTYIR